MTTPDLPELKAPLKPGAMRFGYSNRAPGEYKNGKFKDEFTGGATRVVFDSGLDAWIAQGKVYTNLAEYNALSLDEKFPLHPAETFTFRNRKPLKLYLFPVYKRRTDLDEEETKKLPKSVSDDHYSFANNVFWPIHHNMDPYAFTHPVESTKKKVEEGQHHVFHMDDESLKVGFKDYTDFNNNNANFYLKRLMDHGVINRERGDKVDIHDYQCANVIGDTFLFHIPVPSLDYLKTLKIPFTNKEGKEDYKSILEPGGWFNDYINKIVENHSTINFQRPSDQHNFLQILAYFNRDIPVDNPEVYDSEAKGGIIPQAREHEGVIELSWPDKRRGGFQHIRLMNVPVGTSQEHNLEEALDFEFLFRRGISHRNQIGHDYQPIEYSKEKLASTGIIAPEGATVASILGDTLKTLEDLKQDNSHKPLYARKTAEQLEKEVCGFMVNGHRDDPSKYALAQIEAAKILYEKRPAAKTKMKFLLFVQPSRMQIPVYRKFHEAVVAAAKEAREKYGDAFIIIPDEYRHGEMMALLRHPNMKLKLDAAPWDGHALTAREPADARADLAKWYIEELGPNPSPEEIAALPKNKEQLQKNPPAILMSRGIGASDILGGGEKENGAILFNPHQDFQAYVNSMAKAMINAYDMQYDKDGLPNIEGRKELADRYRVMAAESAKYTGKHYGETVQEVRNMIGARELANRVYQLGPQSNLGQGQRGPSERLLDDPLKGKPTIA